jgi:hypothetical protein
MAWRKVSDSDTPREEPLLVAGGDVLYPIVGSCGLSEEEGWTVDCQGDIGAEIHPTHWMPLPDFP